jgi:hypothetical protein
MSRCFFKKVFRKTLKLYVKGAPAESLRMMSTNRPITHDDRGLRTRWLGEAPSYSKTV